MNIDYVRLVNGHKAGLQPVDEPSASGDQTGVMKGRMVATAQLFDDAAADENASSLAVVLLDMNLPKKRVDEVLRHLRGSVKCRDAKVLIVSSSGEALDRAAVAGFAVVGYFKKPVNYTDFMTLRPFVRGFLNSPTDNPPSGIF